MAAGKGPPPPVNLGTGLAVRAGAASQWGSFLSSCGWRRRSSEVLYVTYQHGLPFNQRVERKDKVKPGSQHQHSDNYHHSGAVRADGGGAAGPAPSSDRDTLGGKAGDVWVRPGLNTLTGVPARFDPLGHPTIYKSSKHFKLIWPRSAGTSCCGCCSGGGHQSNSPGRLDQDLVLLTLQHLEVHDDDLEAEGQAW